MSSLTAAAKAARDAFKERLLSCTHCQDEGLIPAARPIFQLPDHPTIGIFSQAPGNLAHQGGKPFYDPSGKRLRAWLGVTEAEFYDSGRIAIVPMAFCFPGYDGKSPTGKGGDLPPPKVCAEKWRDEAMDLVLPQLKIAFLVGTYAQGWHLPDLRRASLTDRVKRAEKALQAPRPGDGPVLVSLPHPSWRNNAWLKKNPWFEASVIPLVQSQVRQALQLA